jgi:predicted nucleic acid-binding protein
MPVNAARDGTGGRPPWGLGEAAGSSGSRISHSDSGKRGAGIPSHESDPIRVQGFWKAFLVTSDTDPGVARLDPGERAAIALAASVGADAVLMDDRAGVAAARARGLNAIGTLGLLQRGARRGLLDLPGALARLVATNFRVRQELLDTLLAEAGR